MRWLWRSSFGRAVLRDRSLRTMRCAEAKSATIQHNVMCLFVSLTLLQGLFEFKQSCSTFDHLPHHQAGGGRNQLVARPCEKWQEDKRAVSKTPSEAAEVFTFCTWVKVYVLWVKVKKKKYTFFAIDENNFTDNLVLWQNHPGLTDRRSLKKNNMTWLEWFTVMLLLN